MLNTIIYNNFRSCHGFWIHAVRFPSDDPYSKEYVHPEMTRFAQVLSGENLHKHLSHLSYFVKSTSNIQNFSQLS